MGMAGEASVGEPRLVCNGLGEAGMASRVIPRLTRNGLADVDAIA